MNILRKMYSPKSNLYIPKRIKRKILYLLNKRKVEKLRKHYISEQEPSEIDGYKIIYSNTNLTYSKNGENDKILKNGPIVPPGIELDLVISHTPIMSNKEYIAEASDALLVRNMPFGITKTNKLLIDTIGSYLIPGDIEKTLEIFGMHADIDLFDPVKRKKILNNQEEIETACLLISTCHHIYGHWLPEHALKLKKIEKYKEITGEKVKVIVEGDLPKWKSEILSKLGWEEKDIIRWKSKIKRIKKFVIPSMQEPNYKDFLWLKEKMIAGKKGKAKKEKRLYISRKNYSTRNIVNEEELYQVLQKYGFNIICPENLSATEQALLFSEAEIVVGPNGSGLVNVIYSDSIKVMEIFGSIIYLANYVNCLVMGHQHKFFIGEDIINKTVFHYGNDLRSKWKKRENNIYVDPIKFGSSLKELFNN
jgi:hypothetical protein